MPLSVSPIHSLKRCLRVVVIWVMALAVQGGASQLFAQENECITPPPNLVGWWTLDETGPTVFDRASGNSGQRFGSISSISSVVDRALLFHGTNGYVEVPHDPALEVGTGDFSIDLWLRTSVNSTRVQVILDKRDSHPVGYHLYLYRGRIGLQLADFSGHTNYDSGVFVADGHYHHIAVTVARQGTIRFYLDGQPAGATGDPTLRKGSLSNAAPLRLGARSADVSGHWKGVLDEVELFRRVLTAQEVAALHGALKAGKCKCADLAVRPRAWWPFNEQDTVAAVVDVAGDPLGPFDGFANGPQPTPGKVGGALRFDGVNDFVEIPGGAVTLGLDLAKATSFGVDAWIRTTSPSGPIFTNAGPHPLDIGSIGYNFGLSNGTPYFSVAALNPNDFSITSILVECPICPSVADGGWYLLGATLTYDAGGNNAMARLYIDGVQVATAGPVNLVGTAQGGRMIIGAHFHQISTFFQGDIDEPEISSHCLDAEDFQSIFVAGEKGKCGPVLHNTACGSRGVLPFCPGDSFCNFFVVSTACGGIDLGGQCTVRPSFCTGESNPVCGCDGQTYNSPCDAAMLGISVGSLGPC